MIDFDFRNALDHIFTEVNKPFRNSFQNHDSEKLKKLEEESKELNIMLEKHSKKSFEFIVRNNDIKLFREYVNQRSPEQIYSEDQPKGNFFIFRLISLFVELSKDLPEKEKISRCLQHYLLQVNNISNLNFRTQLKSLLKQIHEAFSKETDQNSQDLIQSINKIAEKLSYKLEN